MDNLNLPNPKMMDVAVPANLHIGLRQDEIDAHGWSISCDEANVIADRNEIVLIDLRDRAERQRHGVIPGSVHAPYQDMAENVGPGGLLHELAEATRRRLVFYCAYGELAVKAAQEAGITNACHLKGGVDAWQKSGGRLDRAAG